MSAHKAKFAPTGTGLYPIFVAVMAVVLILSNIGASKPVTFGPILTDGVSSSSPSPISSAMLSRKFMDGKPRAGQLS